MLITENPNLERLLLAVSPLNKQFNFDYCRELTKNCCTSRLTFLGYITVFGKNKVYLVFEVMRDVT